MMKLSKTEEERAIEIHNKSFYMDAHCDTLMSWMPVPRIWGYTSVGKSGPPYGGRNLGERSDYGHIDIPRIKEGGYDGQVFAIDYTNPVYSLDYYNTTPLKRVFQMYDVFRSELEKYPNVVAFCTSYKDIIKAKNENKFVALLSLEGGEPLEGELSILRSLYRLGFRGLQLTYNTRTLLGDGCFEPRPKGGLTDFGAQVVEEMNKIGMLIDISHLNNPGFWNTMELTKSPIVVSHACCSALCEHVRNLDDNQIKALAENGGVMGITYVRSFLNTDMKKVSVETIVDHIEHVIDLVGADHVGLGSDFEGIVSPPDGLEDSTKVINITKSLVSRGHSDQEIEKILGGNFLRVYKKVLTG